MKKILKIGTISTILMLASFYNYNVQAEEFNTEYLNQIKNSIVELNNLSNEEIELLDMNGDGKITVTDLSLLKSKLKEEKTEENSGENSGENSEGKEEKILNKITIKSTPNKKSYSQGEALDLTGLEVIAEYSNGTKEDVTSSVQISGYNNNRLGLQKVAVSYENKKAYFSVRVNGNVSFSIPDRVMGITILSEPNETDYFKDQNIDTTGLVVAKKYMSGNIEEIDNYRVSDFDHTKLGIQDITVTYNLKYTDTFQIEVLDDTVHVEEILLNKYKMYITEGNKEQLVASITPEDSEDKTITWKSLNTEIAVVSDTGEITALAEGTTSIVAESKDGNISSTCDVEVISSKVLVEGVKLSDEEITLIEGNSQTISATITPEDATDKLVKWESSNEDIATVNEDGEVTAISEGTTTITATTNDQDKTAMCKVTVKGITVKTKGVSLDKESVTIFAGSTDKLTATIEPEDATNKEVTWKSTNEDIVTVDENGIITGISVGKAKIICTTNNGDNVASADITVENQPVEEVSLDRNELEIFVGSEESLNAEIKPENASNKNVTWSSSDTSVATVDKNGKITGISKGTATITVKTEDKEKEATCIVNVKNVPVENIKLDKTEVSMYERNTAKLTATVEPSNATDKTIRWESSNSSIAKVDDNGNITGVSVGTAIIRAITNDGDKIATCNVNIKEAPVQVSGVTLNSTQEEIYVNRTVKLLATINPENATNKGVTWESSNTSIATVDSNGVVTGKAEGTAKIIVITDDGSKIATCKIIVKRLPVTGVTLNKTNTEIVVGNTDTLTATVTPSDATIKTVTWSSSNTSVATVNSAGVVVAKSAGTAVITATADGGKTATCAVTVKNVAVTGVTLNKTSLSLLYDTSETLTATVAPSNAENKNVTWSSSNTSIATVSSKGKVTAVGVGTATITVTTEDGNKKATCTVTVTDKAKKMTIKTNLTKTKYSFGENINTSGLTLEVTYISGATKVISSGYSIEGYNSKSLGEQTIKITYDGTLTSTKVTVYDYITSMAVTDFDTEYEQGDALDTDITMTGTYASGKTAKLSGYKTALDITALSNKPSKLTVLGSQKVNYSYVSKNDAGYEKTITTSKTFKVKVHYRKSIGKVTTSTSYAISMKNYESASGGYYTAAQGGTKITIDGTTYYVLAVIRGATYETATGKEGDTSKTYLYILNSDRSVQYILADYCYGHANSITADSSGNAYILNSTKIYKVNIKGLIAKCKSDKKTKGSVIKTTDYSKSFVTVYEKSSSSDNVKSHIYYNNSEGNLYTFFDTGAKVMFGTVTLNSNKTYTFNAEDSLKTNVSFCKNDTDGHPTGAGLFISGNYIFAGRWTNTESSSYNPNINKNETFFSKNYNSSDTRMNFIDIYKREKVGSSYRYTYAGSIVIPGSKMSYKSTYIGEFEDILSYNKTDNTMLIYANSQQTSNSGLNHFYKLTLPTLP